MFKLSVSVSVLLEGEQEEEILVEEDTDVC